MPHQSSPAQPSPPLLRLQTLKNINTSSSPSLRPPNIHLSHNYASHTYASRPNFFNIPALAVSAYLFVSSTALTCAAAPVALNLGTGAF